MVEAHKKGLSGKKNKRSQNTSKEKKKITPLGVCDGDEVEIIFAPGGLLLRGVQDTQVRKGKATT